MGYSLQGENRFCQGARGGILYRRGLLRLDAQDDGGQTAGTVALRFVAAAVFQARAQAGQLPVLEHRPYVPVSQAGEIFPRSALGPGPGVAQKRPHLGLGHAQAQLSFREAGRIGHGLPGFRGLLLGGSPADPAASSASDIAARHWATAAARTSAFSAKNGSFWRRLARSATARPVNLMTNPSPAGSVSSRSASTRTTPRAKADNSSSDSLSPMASAVPRICPAILAVSLVRALSRHCLRASASETRGPKAQVRPTVNRRASRTWERMAGPGAAPVSAGPDFTCGGRGCAAPGAADWARDGPAGKVVKSRLMANAARARAQKGAVNMPPAAKGLRPLESRARGMERDGRHACRLQRLGHGQSVGFVVPRGLEMEMMQVRFQPMLRPWAGGSVFPPRGV